MKLKEALSVDLRCGGGNGSQPARTHLRGGVQGLPDKFWLNLFVTPAAPRLHVNTLTQLPLHRHAHSVCGDSQVYCFNYEVTTTVYLFPSCAPKSNQSPIREQRSTCCVQVFKVLPEIHENVYFV